MIAKLKSIPIWKHRLLALLGIVGIVVLSAIGMVIYWAIRPNIAPEWTGIREYSYSTFPRLNMEVVPARTL